MRERRKRYEEVGRERSDRRKIKRHKERRGEKKARAGWRNKKDGRERPGRGTP